LVATFSAEVDIKQIGKGAHSAPWAAAGGRPWYAGTQLRYRSAHLTPVSEFRLDEYRNVLPVVTADYISANNLKTGRVDVLQWIVIGVRVGIQSSS
jgi:hypothetical protein